MSKKESLPQFEIKQKRPILPMFILFSVLIIGMIGYSILWEETDATLLDAIYMTVITITTVGYAEIYPLNDAGRIFTIFIAIGGIGSLFYVLSVFMENLVIMQIQDIRGKKKMLKNITRLSNHLVLVGYGRVGYLAAQELLKSNEDFIVIDDSFHDPEFIKLDERMLYVEGDATTDDILLKAGIDRARGMIVATANASTTVFVVLSAKVLNPKLFVVARADYEADVEKLKRAGADRVVNPYSIGGQRLANLMINTNLIEFFETNLGAGEENLKIENIKLPENCVWYGKTFKELELRQKIGASILAVIRNEQPFLNPGGDFQLMSGDQLVAMGTRKQLKNLEEMTDDK